MGQDDHVTAKPRPTLAHVAKAAHVSVTTASAALRGTGRVNDQTREHVQEVARKLGYRKNSGASALREGAGQLVGLVLEPSAFDADPLNPKLFWPRFLNGFCAQLNASGMGVVLVSRGHLEPLAHAPIDVLVVLADLVEQLTAELPFGMPIIGGSAAAPGVVATATHDYPAIVAECVRHFREQGGHRIAFVVPHSPVPTMEQVYRLLEEQATTQGLSVERANSTSDAVRAVVESGADALVTAGESVGGIISAIDASGRSIPQDVLLLSLSESDVTETFDPPVTTMCFEGYASGRAVADVARKGLAEGEFASVTLPHKLYQRESTMRR